MGPNRSLIDRQTSGQSKVAIWIVRKSGTINSFRSIGYIFRIWFIFFRLFSKIWPRPIICDALETFRFDKGVSEILGGKANSDTQVQN